MNDLITLLQGLSPERFDQLSAPMPVPLSLGPLPEYPSFADAQYAQRMGMAGNSPYAPMIEQGRANIMKRAGTDIGTGSGIMKEIQGGKGSSVQQSQDIANELMQAYLAVNRNPIAALGFDPHKIYLDTKSGPASDAGLYSRSHDIIYSNTQYPGNLVHESIHRGITQLKNSGKWPADLPEEDAVRYMMYKLAGDPEKERGGDVRKNAIIFFEKLNLSDRHKKLLDKALKDAADMIAWQHPGGPR